ncbi:irregular chiasm C-roughest protein teiresias [Cochliomyia hominivorax]
MRPTFDRSLYKLLFIILIQCISYTQQQNIKPVLHQKQQQLQQKPAADYRNTNKNNSPSLSSIWNPSYTEDLTQLTTEHQQNRQLPQPDLDEEENYSLYTDDNEKHFLKTHYQTTAKQLTSNTNSNTIKYNVNNNKNNNLILNLNLNEENDNEDNDLDHNLIDHVNIEKCAKNCKQNQKFPKDLTTESNKDHKLNKNYTPTSSASLTYPEDENYDKDDEDQDLDDDHDDDNDADDEEEEDESTLSKSKTSLTSSSSSLFKTTKNSNKLKNIHSLPSQMPLMSERNVYFKTHESPAKLSLKALKKTTKKEHQRIHVAHRLQHKEVKTHRETNKQKHNRETHKSFKATIDHNNKHSNKRSRRETEENDSIQFNESTKTLAQKELTTSAIMLTESSLVTAKAQHNYLNETLVKSSPALLTTKTKRSHSNVRVPVEVLNKPKESMIIIDDGEEFEGAAERQREYASMGVIGGDDKSEDYQHDEEPRVLPLRPVLPNPYEDEEMSVVYAEQHSEIRLMCEVDLDIASSMWYKNGQVVHAMDRTTRVTDYRFIKEANGALTITNVMLEDDGKWQCEAENTRHYTENARPVKLVVLDRPKPPYLLIDGRRLDAGNIFVPVKENSELNLACISEGGNPKPTLTWEVLLSPGVDRHAQKVSAEVLELEEIKNDKDKNSYKINSGAKSEARLPAVYRAHHNARILCVMEHPTLKIRQNASLLLDVQYTPSFAISRTPGFGYPLREGIEVSLKCDVDSNPPSTPRWQKDDGEPPVPQTGDGFLNFTSIRREHSGWYKCTSRHLNFQYSSIGYYLSVRYDSVDVTSEPDDQDISVAAAASHNPNKGQLEVQLGGAVTLQCPQGSLGCWSHLDPVTARLRGLGHGLSTPTGQFSLKDVVYQDAGTYKCIGQSPINKKKLEVLQTVGVTVKGFPTVMARNSTPVAYPGSPLHLSVEFCANPPAHAARWLHGDRVYTPGNQYGSTVLAYGVKDLPTPFCKEARLTYISMHERVPRTFYFIVSSPGGVAEAVIKVNFTMRYRSISNAIDEEEEELSEPEEIHFPVFGSANLNAINYGLLVLMGIIYRVI